ncbi:MAG: hypothetical protein D6806_11840 [Deltaproteobacteria bacterium]|nr:MAG: hypothetical protein D6806_11840 [Deltaproteobacteria bacterium]
MTREEIDQIATLFDKGQQETMRHFDAVAEELKGDIRLIVEGHTILVDKIGVLDGRVERTEQRTERIEIKVDALDKKIDTLEKKFNTLDKKLGDFIEETGANLDDLRSAVKFSYAELDRRVGQLENMVVQLAARVQRLEEKQKSQ